VTTVLRPMSLGEVLDRTFTLYRKNFALFAGIAALPPAVLLVLQLGLIMMGWQQEQDPGKQLSSGAAVGLVFGTLLTVVVWVLGFAVAQTALVRAVSAIHLDRPITLRQAFVQVRGRYGSVLGAIMIVLVMIWSVSFFVIMAAALLFGMVGVLHPTVGLVIALAVGGTGLGFGFYFVLRFALAVQACTLEDVNAADGMRRSWRLTQGNVSRVFIVYFLLLVLTYAIAITLTLPAMFLGNTFEGGNFGFWAQVFKQVASFVASTLSGPFAAIALSVIYYDERVRREAFDLQLMMTANAPSAPPPLANGASNSIG
jgi:hypothetical protein